MLKLTFVVHPEPSHPRYGKVDCAYAVVFVRDPVRASGEAAARGLLEDSGWNVDELEARDLMWPDLEPGAALGPYYEEALREGMSAILHTWPVGASDG